MQESTAAELARRSENLKSAVLDALAHEIKGPLATVKVSVSTLLSQQSGNPAQRRELLSIIDEEVDRIEHWIDDAVEVSRKDAGELRLTKVPHSLRPVATRALEGLGPRADGRPIDVRIPASLPIVTFDEEMMEKVIRLLLDNAVKYSPPGSPIDVSAEFTGAEIVLSVADHGCGIPDGERERIFEKYYRGGAMDGVPGTGLGLASAKCIMEAHGGEIWVSSTPGSGSVFHIFLPVSMKVSDERSASLERR
jgi:two-component system sensor histidine kinase KdpD